MKANKLLSLVALGQGAYYLVTGVWPIVHRRSFEAVTGPKADFWLVKTIGGVLAAVGAALALAGARQVVSPEVAVLGAGSAAALACSDLVYSATGRVRPIYRAEAIPELGLIGLWIVALAS